MSRPETDSVRRGWRRVRLGDVVDNINDFRDRDNSEAMRYVAGEHIDEGDLNVRRYGLTSDEAVPPTFNRLFKSGDVLFHSRNIKKLGQPDFDGLTGEKLFVLRTKNQDELMQEFLPYLLQNNSFGSYVEERSAGSTNKFLNKAPLMAYEFSLPPIVEQTAIVKRLNTATEAVRSAQDLLQTAKKLLSSYLAEAVPARGESVPLQELCACPITYGIVQAGPDRIVGVPYVRVSEMTNCDELDPLRMMKTSEEVHRSYARTILEEGDIVVALRGVPGLAHMVPEYLAGGNLSRGVARLAVGDRCLNAYLLWALRSPVVQRSVLQYANGWKGEDLREITIADLRRLPVPVPDRTRQKEVAKNAAGFQLAISKARRRVEAARSVQRALTAQALGGGL